MFILYTSSVKCSLEGFPLCFKDSPGWFISLALYSAIFRLPSAAVIYLIFQESKSDNSQDNNIIIVERVAGSTQLEDASSSADWYFT